MVHLFLANGFEEIEAITTLDILRRAGIEVQTISISGSRSVIGAHGISIKADDIYRRSGLVNSDCIILPGGMPGSENLRNHPGVCNALKAQAARGAYIAAICAAPGLVLGSLGLLEGKNSENKEQYRHQSTHTISPFLL